MTPPDRRGARALQLGLGLAVSAGMVWWAFHKYPFATIWHAMLSAHPVPLLVAVLLATVPFPLRVPRWRLLLRRQDGAELAPKPLWQAIAIGFASNNILPFRAGELLRVAAITRLAPVSFGAALSSLAVERVMDALVVLALLGGALVSAHFPADLRIGSALPIRVFATRLGVACLVALAVAIIAAWQRERTLRLMHRILPHNRVGYALHAFGERVLLGLEALRDIRRSAPIVGWTLIVWVVNAAGFYAAFRAFDFPVPFEGALILQGVLMIGIALPQAPGYFGVFEAAIAGVLVALYAVPQERALGYALAYHITTFIPITLLGAMAATRSGVHLRVPHAEAP